MCLAYSGTSTISGLESVGILCSSLGWESGHRIWRGGVELNLTFFAYAGMQLEERFEVELQDAQ
jgi:hypothetical protein